jgi:YVTN family beta-propeller protein
VSFIDAIMHAIVAGIPVGRRPWGIAVTPDGRKLCTADGLSRDVSVIDVAARRVTATIPAGDGPWDVVIGR